MQGRRSCSSRPLRRGGEAPSRSRRTGCVLADGSKRYFASGRQSAYDGRTTKASGGTESEQDMKTELRIAFAAVAAGATAALGLDQAGAIKLGKGATVALIIVIGVVAVLTPVVEAIRERTLAQQLEDQKHLTDALRASIVLVATLPGMNWGEIGASVFVVKRSGLLRRTKTMDRIAYERFAFLTPPTPASWQSGKGVIGKCWASGNDEGADLARIGTTWNTLTDAQRFQLTPAEFAAINPKEGMIACPLIRDNEVYGVVSLSAPSSTYPTLTSAPVWLALRTTRDAVHNLLS